MPPIAFGDEPCGAAGSEHQYPIPAADGVTIDRKAQIIVVRYQQHLYAFNLACPHENTALKWLPKDGRFQCPKHESRYQPSGQFIDGRATRNMDRLGVRVENNMLVVDVNKFYKSDKDPAAGRPPPSRSKRVATTAAASATRSGSCTRSPRRRPRRP